MPRLRELTCVRPPRVVIDLSEPPRERYKALARAHAAQLRSLTGLYDELLVSTGISPRLVGYTHVISRLLMRRLYDTEQTQELKGISEVTGVPMYLLVAFNVVLDLLMGCTSGGVLSQENKDSRSSMLHFRTLDWDMDPLRSVVVQLDFIRSGSPFPDTIVASSITYIGFVGILTGVRKGLSLSLNFRAVHDATTVFEQVRFYTHHLMVLLGIRPSIATIIRQHLLNDCPRSVEPSVEAVVTDIARRHTTAAYLIFSDGHTTVTMEKDSSTAVIDRSDTFIARTNHDVSNHETKAHPRDKDVTRAIRTSVVLEELLDESRDRLGCITEQYETKMKAANLTRRRSTRIRQKETERTGREPSFLPTRAEIIQWLCTWTTTNESTHYAVVMDPKVGEISWCRAYPRPLSEPWEGSRDWYGGSRHDFDGWRSIAARDVGRS